MPTSISKVEERLKDTIAHLSPEKLMQLADYAEYLRSRESWEATMEIMCDPEMQKAVDKGLEEERQGKMRPWREIKQDV